MTHFTDAKEELSMDDDLVQFLRDCFGEDEQTARATHPVFLEWEYDEFVKEIRDLGNGNEIASVLPQYGAHIARHEPARVLREVEAKRQLLADVLAEQHFSHEEDHWYSCAALTDDQGDPLCFDEARAPGPCDCGRDNRVQRRLHFLALPYADRPDYREEWRP